MLAVWLVALLLTGCSTVTVPVVPSSTVPLPSDNLLDTTNTNTGATPSIQIDSRKTYEQNEDDRQLTGDARWERADLLTKKAEYLMVSNEPSEALELFERALRLGENHKTEKKAAHAAFVMRQFPKSIDWYAKNGKTLSIGEKEEYLKALRYTGSSEFRSILGTIDIPIQTKKYYEVSWICEYEYISCEKSIESYGYDDPRIQLLREAINNYKTADTDDENYKDALLIGAWYKNKDYSTIIKIGKQVLQKKPDYRPILKVVWFSAYMIGDHATSETILKQYKQYEPKDVEADFLLWLINFEKRNYETANLFFNKAVTGGYKPKIVVERKLVYNYHILGLEKNMFQVLSYLILEPDVTESDITNALYLALRAWEYRLANEWVKKWTEKYPDSDDIQALRSWNLRVQQKNTSAQIIIDETLKKNEKNLIALVQAGILAYESWDKLKAKKYLEEAKFIDAHGNWSEEIEKYLGQI